jgi:uncharacterized protein (DUF1800 family)
MELNPLQINHLYNRACFGIDYNEYLGLKNSSDQVVMMKLFNNYYHKKALNVFGASPDSGILQKIRSGEVTRQEARQMIRGQIEASRDKIRSLNVAWVEQMQTPSFAGLEKLVYFWHDHFGVRVLNGYHVEAHNNTLRLHALGNYKDLLLAVAKDPAMISFLNNQQNVKAQPNENFSRELLELFTIGRGNYSEKDVKEAARAFTGWRMNRRTASFTFDERNHDYGQKEFMGKKGKFDGEDIIEIILKDPRTAHFIAAKFYAFYVSDIPNEKHITELAEYYYKHEYHTQSLLKYMFMQPWFYEKSVVQSKIKSPLELINGYQSQLGLSFGNKSAWLLMQRRFNQTMFYPPSVAGWPQGKEWIDSSSLLKRMKMPAVLNGMSEVHQEESPELDAADPFKPIDRKQTMESAELGLWAYQLPEGTEEEQVYSIEKYLFNKTLPNELHQKVLEGFKKQPKHKSKNWLFITMTSLPEYQMT